MTATDVDEALKDGESKVQKFVDQVLSVGLGGKGPFRVHGRSQRST